MAKKLRPEQVDLSQYYNKSESVPLIQGTNITITESEAGVTISSSGGGGGGSSAWEDITNKPATFTPSPHNHTASEITSGTLDVGRIPTGTTSSTVSLGNHTHDEITNAVDLTSISGYNPAVSQYLTHNASGVLVWANS